MMRKQTPIGRQRLEKLATFLYNVPRERFNMTRWIFNVSGTLSLDAHKCNTQGCAIGWASVLFADNEFCLKPDSTYDISMPNWAGHEGWGAILAFFDIPKGAATSLFSNTRTTANMGPRQVAVRIRRFLKTGRI